MTKMPPHSYLTSHKPAQRLQFPRPGDSSLFENSGKRHYHNHVIFSTPYALFQDNSKNHRNFNISLPQSRKSTQVNPKNQEYVFNRYNQLNSYVDNDYDRMKKQKDTLDQQLINLRHNRQSQLYPRPKQLEIQLKYAQKPQNIEQEYIKRSQVNIPQKNLVQYNSIQPKGNGYHSSAQQLPFTNPKKINRERIKTEAIQTQQYPQDRYSALNRNVRFNPTYLSWIN